MKLFYKLDVLKPKFVFDKYCHARRRIWAVLIINSASEIALAQNMN